MSKVGRIRPVAIGLLLGSVAIGLLLGIVVVATRTISLNSGSAVSEQPPIQRSDAEALLDEAVRLAQSGDFAGLCQSVAASRGNCEVLLTSAREAGWKPGLTKPVVVGTTGYDDTESSPQTLVLHVEGVRADSSKYTSDFSVIRDNTKGNSLGLGSLTPVYWSGVKFGNSSGPCAEQLTSPGSVCARGAATAPPAPSR